MGLKNSGYLSTSRGRIFLRFRFPSVYDDCFVFVFLSLHRQVSLHASEIPTGKLMKNRLREERILQNISQTDLAKAVDVSRQSIHAIEKGKYVPSTLLALKIARILQKSVEDIFMID